MSWRTYRLDCATQISGFVSNRIKAKIKAAQHFSCLGGKKISLSEWLQLSSLVTLYVLGQCPDCATAEEWGVSDKVLALFRRILEGQEL